MKIRFSGQAAAVVHPVPEVTPEETYFDELLRAIRDSEPYPGFRRERIGTWPTPERPER